MPKPKRQFAITPAALGKFLSSLDRDLTVAQTKYEFFYRRLVAFFRFNHCPDAEQAADTTIDRVIQKIDEGTAMTNFNGFVFGIAKNVLKENQKLPTTVPLPQDLAAPPDNHADEEREVQCLDRCLKTLKPEARELFLAYYGEGAREELALRYNTSMNAIRIKVFKCKPVLNQCMTECLSHHNY